MDDEIKTRFRWVALYLETKDAGLVCRKCGISRPTLRQWARRYKSDRHNRLSGSRYAGDCDYSGIQRKKIFDQDVIPAKFLPSVRHYTLKLGIPLGRSFSLYRRLKYVAG